MKDDEIYPFYENFINNKLLIGKITKGSASIFKISYASFEQYKNKFQNDKEFKKEQLELYKSEARDQKIKDILSESD
jgi:hypothetical protein